MGLKKYGNILITFIGDLKKIKFTKYLSEIEMDFTIHRVYYECVQSTRDVPQGVITTF